MHAASDPHDPPEYINERARDLVDLVLLHRLISETGQPSTSELKAAIHDVFEARAAEARAIGRNSRLLPTKIVAYPHWAGDYQKTAHEVGVTITMEEAAVSINDWLDTFQ